MADVAVNTKRYKHLAMAGDKEDIGLERVKTTRSERGYRKN